MLCLTLVMPGQRDFVSEAGLLDDEVAVLEARLQVSCEILRMNSIMKSGFRTMHYYHISSVSLTE